MSFAVNAVRTGVFTLLVPLVVAVLVPQRMLARSSVATTIGWQLTGATLLVLGAVGYFWCATLFAQAEGTPAPIAPTQRTVVSGPYRVNRNPMYTSVLAVVFGQALLYRSPRVAEYGACLFVCFHLFVMFYEEPTLRGKFDGEYEDFCQRVPRWVPRLHAQK